MRSARAAIRLGRARARRARRSPLTRADRARRRVRLPGIWSEPRRARAAHGVRGRVSVRPRVPGRRQQRRNHRAPAPAPRSARARRPALRLARTPPAHGATRADPGRSADRLRPPARGELRAAPSARPLRTPPSARADVGTPPHDPASASLPTPLRARPSPGSRAAARRAIEALGRRPIPPPPGVAIAACRAGAGPAAACSSARSQWTEAAPQAGRIRRQAGQASARAEARGARGDSRPSRR